MIEANNTSKIVKGLVSGTVIILIILVGYLLAHLSWQMSEDVVSGIIYDASFDEWPTGNTCFSVRAAAEMAVTEKTSPRYCLPEGSQYTDIVRQAAADKDIKVVVTVKKTLPHLRKRVLAADDNIEVKIKGE